MSFQIMSLHCIFPDGTRRKSQIGTRVSVHRILTHPVIVGRSSRLRLGLRMASWRGLSEIVLAQLGALNFFVWAVANSMSSTQLRTYTGIEYIVYMYNLGTAPNVQNWAGFACCTPGYVVGRVSARGRAARARRGGAARARARACRRRATYR